MQVRYYVHMRSLSPHRGVSLVDVVVGSALVAIIFLALVGIIRASLAVSSLAKLKNTATSIASTRMEYIRSLSYGSVGTVGGIPAGVVPQYATTTVENVEFVTRVFIEYVDDAADGFAGLDENGITTDYKQVKVATSYVANQTARNVTLVSNFAPPGIESTTGGGTLQVSVVDALGLPVSGAEVRIVNSALTPSVDVATFSNAAGIVYLGGAATSTEYQVAVSKEAYSSAQTYERDAINVNPTPGYLTVAEGQTTVGTFTIDRVSTLVLKTFSPIAPQVYVDSLDDESALVSTANVQSVAGALTLSGAVGSYPVSGSATSVDITPEYLVSWENASSTFSTPFGTSVQFYIEDGEGVLIPDTDLMGNSAGFTGSIDLSMLSTSTYPTLALRAELSSSDVNVTPEILSWAVGYDAGPLPLPDVPVTLAGSKTIGSMTDGTPLYKTELATTTNGVGERTLSLEWDLYALSIAGYTILSQDPEAPYELLPQGTVEAHLILTP